MDTDEKRFQLLMSEKSFADGQIGSFFDLQVKVLTFLGASIVLLGWIYSEKATPARANLPVIAIALVVIGCSVLLQGVVMYGSSLGYLEHKMTTLNEEFARILSQETPPFTAFWTWRNSCTQPPVALSVLALFAMHVIVNSVLLYIAGNYPGRSASFHVSVAATAVYLATTCVAEGLLLRAQEQLMLQQHKVTLRCNLSSTIMSTEATNANA